MKSHEENAEETQSGLDGKDGVLTFFSKEWNVGIHVHTKIILF